MLTIYKYAVPIEEKFEIEMPMGATLLDVQIQPGPRGDNPYLWALVNTRHSMTKQGFYLRSTGQDLDKQLKGVYVGSFQIQTGLMWHVLVYHLFAV